MPWLIFLLVNENRIRSLVPIPDPNLAWVDSEDEFNWAESYYSEDEVDNGLNNDSDDESSTLHDISGTLWVNILISCCWHTPLDASNASDASDASESEASEASETSDTSDASDPPGLIADINHIIPFHIQLEAMNNRLDIAYQTIKDVVEVLRHVLERLPPPPWFLFCFLELVVVVSCNPCCFMYSQYL